MDKQYPRMDGMTVWLGADVPDDDRVALELLGAYTAGPGGSRERRQPTHEYVVDGYSPAHGLPLLSSSDLADRIAKAREGFEAFLARHTRIARIPVVAPVVDEGLGTRWFGRPCMPASTGWPEGNLGCMDFVLQFDAADIPGGLPGGACGLLLFIEEGGCGDGEDAEVILIHRGEACVLHDLPEVTKSNPPLGVVGWREVVDHPWLSEEDDLEGSADVVDLGELLTSMTYGEVTLAGGRNLPEAEAAMQDVPPLCHAWECDKVGGWPRWEQSKDVPLDREGKPMRFVMQVGYKGLLLGDFDEEAVDWPTWGRGQVFVSETTGEARYVWACD